MSPTYRELLEAGYAPASIHTCPAGNPCPCQTHGLQRDCKLVILDWPRCEMGFVHPPCPSPTVGEQR